MQPSCRVGTGETRPRILPGLFEFRRVRHRLAGSRWTGGRLHGKVSIPCTPPSFAADRRCSRNTPAGLGTSLHVSLAKNPSCGHREPKQTHPSLWRACQKHTLGPQFPQHRHTTQKFSTLSYVSHEHDSISVLYCGSIAHQAYVRCTILSIIYYVLCSTFLPEGMGPILCSNGLTLANPTAKRQ